MCCTVLHHTTCIYRLYKHTWLVQLCDHNLAFDVTALIECSHVLTHLTACKSWFQAYRHTKHVSASEQHVDIVHISFHRLLSMTHLPYMFLTLLVTFVIRLMLMSGGNLCCSTQRTAVLHAGG